MAESVGEDVSINHLKDEVDRRGLGQGHDRQHLTGGFRQVLMGDADGSHGQYVQRGVAV
jgi:hypothetical protein